MSASKWLKSRGILRVVGSDTVKFLQGLVTVNIHRLCPKHESIPEKSLFGAFLNRKGRIEHTALLVTGTQRRNDGCPEEIFVDCHRDSTEPLLKHLVKHRMRAKVDIDDFSAEMAVAAHTPDTETADDRFMEDPRLSVLHRRALVPLAEASQLDVGDVEYEIRRVLLGVPDGPDFKDQPLPLNLALHMLSAVDFDKGCYLGQELTARTHFTGVLRKRITPVAIGVDAETVQTALERNETPEELLNKSIVLKPETKLYAAAAGAQGGRAAGVVSSAASNCGLAVLKPQQVFDGAHPEHDRVGIELVTEDGQRVTPWKPSWWVDEQTVEESQTE